MEILDVRITKILREEEFNRTVVVTLDTSEYGGRSHGVELAFFKSEWEKYRKELTFPDTAKYRDRSWAMKIESMSKEEWESMVHKDEVKRALRECSDEDLVRELKHRMLFGRIELKAEVLVKR